LVEPLLAIALHDRNEGALPLNSMMAIRYVPLNVCERF
jgi:hypothetical protein